MLLKYLRSLFIVLFFVHFTLSKSTWAFPNMVRHNYVNCTSCHLSPTGGGVLTQYGRELSGAILSTWETENESKPAWGVAPLPSWLDAMGTYRGVYAYQNTPYIQQGQYIFMEGDAEAAVHYKKWYLDASLGYQNPPNATTFSDHWISRTHYIGLFPTEETSLRFGRYFVAYGINTSVHTRFIKQNLGWNVALNRESYNLEAAWIGPALNVFASADFGRPDDPDEHLETGAALTVSEAIEDHYKLGVSYFYGNGQNTTRNVFGPWAILGFTPKLSLLTEWDFQQAAEKVGGTSSQWGLVNYVELGYEAIQGVQLYGIAQYSRLNFADQKTLQNSYGLGVDWFPRPHFEVNLEWQKLKTAQNGDAYTDFAWLMLNIYI